MATTAQPATQNPAKNPGSTAKSAPAGKSQTAAPASKTTERLVSLDAYRGFIMLAMASAGFGIAKVAKSFPDSQTWQFFGYQFDHVAWRGCAVWDLIQPSFMFMVGVAMAYSYATRAAKGQSYRGMMLHAAIRSLVLVLLGVFLSSNWSKETNWTFVNVLAQIGLGYFFLFLLWGRRPWVQWLAAIAILGGYWSAFYFYPVPNVSANLAQYNLPDKATNTWQPLKGIESHWEKNVNIAADADRWFLNLFPREKYYSFSTQKVERPALIPAADTAYAALVDSPRKVFQFNEGGYQTLNFIPALATMIFGLLAGELLRGPRKGWAKFGILVGCGLLGVAAGYGLDYAGVCPIVKRIWTPSWTLFSGGLAVLMLAGFYAVVDLLGWKRWTFPLVVVGMNSIAIYMMSQLLKPWMRDTLTRHISPNLFDMFGTTYTPILEMAWIVLAWWLICYWMYRQKIFVRI